MAGSVSDIQLASNALILLGHEPISSFEEPTAGAQVASNLFKSSYEHALTMHRWRFAAKKVKLARLTAVPLGEYAYKHQLPTDCLYVIKALSGDYEIYEDKLYSNTPEETIDYIYKVASDRLPAYFVKMCEFFLASQFALTITGDINKTTVMTQIFEKMYRQARFLDSTQRPADSFEDNPYVDVRW